MATLWAQTAQFDSISVGDDLPILVKFEFHPPAQGGADAPEENPVGVEKLTAYVKELLLKAFPPDNVSNEATSIKVEIQRNFVPSATVSVCGQVVGKPEEAGKRAVECDVTVESQEGETLAKAWAAVSF